VNISSDDNASAIVVYFVPKDKSVRNNKDELTRRICTAYVDKLRSILN
jgi:hypothetical protein